MNDGASSRVRDTFKICSMICVTALVVGVAVPVAANAAAQLFMLVGPSGDKAKVSDIGALKVGDGSGRMTVDGSVGVTGQPIVRARELPFGVHHRLEYSEDGVGGCAGIELPGNKLILKSVMVTTTYATTTPIVYLKMIVLASHNPTGSIMVLRVPLTTNAPDPVPNTRAGVLNFELVADGGGLFEAGIGEIADVEVCMRKTSGEEAKAAFQLNGVRMP
jgi:hypothetical protein